MITVSDLSAECTFKAVRSSGKGGQHVNKVSTKVELYFTVNESQHLSDNEKLLIAHKLLHRINDAGQIRIVCDEFRSQKKNRDGALEKLYTLIEKALTPVKPRIKTRTPAAIREKRIQEKKVKSKIKELRRKPLDD